MSEHDTLIDRGETVLDPTLGSEPEAPPSADAYLSTLQRVVNIFGDQNLLKGPPADRLSAYKKALLEVKKLPRPSELDPQERDKLLRRKSLVWQSVRNIRQMFANAIKKLEPPEKP